VLRRVPHLEDNRHLGEKTLDVPLAKIRSGVERQSIHARFDFGHERLQPAVCVRLPAANERPLTFGVAPLERDAEA